MTDVARIRSIHPRALESKKLRVATAECERVYWRLQVLCDDEGRCEDDADLLASMLFPGLGLSAALVDCWLWDLAELGLIARYTGDGRGVIQIIKWSEFQHPQHPTKSKLAPFHPGTERERPIHQPLPEDDGKPHEDSARAQDGSFQDGSGIGEAHGSDVVSPPREEPNGNGADREREVQAIHAQRLAVVQAAKAKARSSA